MLGHAKIWVETVKSNPLQAKKDAITPVLIAAKRYQEIIPPRELWLEPKPDFFKPEGLIWYTDGSLMNGKAVAEIYGHSPRVKISLSLGQYATVYQAEIAAITACVRENLTKGYSNKHIHTFAATAKQH